jgi:hypothetical protein
METETYQDPARRCLLSSGCACPRDGVLAGHVCIIATEGSSLSHEMARGGDGPKSSRETDLVALLSV